jgi:hypothetical protein
LNSATSAPRWQDRCPVVDPAAWSGGLTSRHRALNGADVR